MNEQILITPQNIKKAIAISKLSPVSRTSDETKLYTTILGEFEFIKKKVSKENYADALLAAAENLKYLRVPANKFLYHIVSLIDRSSQFIYFILSGEAWEFREKTQYELEADQSHQSLFVNKPKAQTPKLLETVDLAKKTKERRQITTKTPMNNNAYAPSPTLQSKPQTLLNGEVRKSTTKLRPLENELNSPLKEGNSTLLHLKTMEKNSMLNNLKAEEHPSFIDEKDIGKKTKGSLFDKIRQKRALLTFENDYFANMIRKNTELNIKYMKDGINIMKFYNKYEAFSTIGEVDVDIAYTAQGAVLAYTGLDVLVLDQAGFVKVFSPQARDARDKCRYFQEHFPTLEYDALKTICNYFTEQKFKINEIIYSENSPCGDALYFVKSGEVQLHKSVENPKSLLPTQKSHFDYYPQPAKNPKLLIANLIKNHFFGEEILFGYPLRSFTAKAITNASCYKLNIEVLKMLPESIVTDLFNIATSKQIWRIERLQNMPLNVLDLSPQKKDESTITELKEKAPAPKPQDFKTIFSYKPSEMIVLTTKMKKQISSEYISDFLKKFLKECNDSNHDKSSKDSLRKKPKLKHYTEDSLLVNKPDQKSLMNPSPSFEVVPPLSFRSIERNYNFVQTDRIKEDIVLKRPMNRTLTDQSCVSWLFEDGNRESNGLSPIKVKGSMNLKDDLLQSFREKSFQNITFTQNLNPVNPGLKKKVPQPPASFGNLIKNISYVSPKDVSISREILENKSQVKDTSRDKSLGFWSFRSADRPLDGNSIEEPTPRAKLETESLEPKARKLAPRLIQLPKRAKIPHLKIRPTKNLF